MRDGLRYRGKGLKKEVWFSFCSAHYHYNKDCKLCNSGNWHNLLGHKISSLIYKISPKLWGWLINKF